MITDIKGTNDEYSKASNQTFHIDLVHFAAQASELTVR